LLVWCGVVCGFVCLFVCWVGVSLCVLSTITPAHPSIHATPRHAPHPTPPTRTKKDNQLNTHGWIAFCLCVCAKPPTKTPAPKPPPREEAKVLFCVCACVSHTFVCVCVRACVCLFVCLFVWLPSSFLCACCKGIAIRAVIMTHQHGGMCCLWIDQSVVGFDWSPDLCLFLPPCRLLRSNKYSPPSPTWQWGRVRANPRQQKVPRRTTPSSPFANTPNSTGSAADKEQKNPTAQGKATKSTCVPLPPLPVEWGVFLPLPTGTPGCELVC
jgi:hypothetical protein